MKPIDWAVLAITLVVIVAYGTWKTRGIKSVDSYLRGGSDTRWYTIGLSIMATQASAMAFLSATIVPLYYRLKVYTAYEYLERRFDLKTRLLTAFIFLLQRGLAAGISIYAPAIILSTVLGWPLQVTNLVIGSLVIIYTVSGGTRAVNQTQTYQMVIMLIGMGLAFVFIVSRLPASVSFSDAVGIAGALGKLNVVDFSTDLKTRYTLWSGMAGGLLVALAYFGTDQSQVQRYLSGSTLTESRLGLLFNGLVKVPMQFLILFVGVVVFVFYQFHPPPVFFNSAELEKVRHSSESARITQIESSYSGAFAQKTESLQAWISARRSGDSAMVARARQGMRGAEERMQQIRSNAKELIATVNPKAERKDADYIFISFVIRYFPAGLIGLLVAVIFCAAMSATAAALNALGTTSMVDFYRRVLKPDGTNEHYLAAARGFTVFWGVVAMLFAAFASQLDNLIQAVNILGSIFYGPMLGVFLVGFFMKWIRGTAAFWATVIAQIAVVLVFAYSNIGFLWYNVIGCAAVVALASAFQIASSPLRRTPPRSVA